MSCAATLVPILTAAYSIVNPGVVSGHVHSIVGGSNFDKSMTYESTQASGCTTAAVSVDKSNYWTPQLYYYDPKATTYEAIPIDVVNTYYLPRAGKDGKVQAFPDGLRMISGSPFRRDYNSARPDDNAVSYVCLDYAGGHKGDPEWAQRNSFFNHNCPNGMRAQVFFRSCWDGVNLDSADHMSHMAWPSGGVDGGECPKSHPVRLVSLFYEFIYRVQDFPHNGAAGPTWVFANGDTTGYGMHGDFLNGWPAYNNGTNVLQQAIDGCNQNNGVGGVLENCPPFVPFLNSDAAYGCQPQNFYVNEDVGFNSPLKALPGNNPIWIGAGPKPSLANYTEGNTTYTNFKSVIPDGYDEVGCVAEPSSGRALGLQSFTAANMTRAACVNFCQSFGLPLAGIEYGSECYCDKAMRNGASNTTLLSAYECGSKCSGNSYETCGGSRTLSLYNNPDLYATKPLPVGWSATGCYKEASGSRALKGYSFSGNTMTQESCMAACQTRNFTYAGVEYGRECYCSNTLGGPGAADDADCSMPCAADGNSQCGGPSRLNVFTFASSAPVTPSASVSPSASASASASPKVSVASSISSSAAKSSASSVSASASSVSSVRSSAVASSSTSASSAVAPSSSAARSSSSSSSSASSSAAASSTVSSASRASSTTIASSAAPSSSAVVSSTASSASSAAASPSALVLPAGWASKGCYTEATSARALASFTYADPSVTVTKCLSLCQQNGFKLCGVEYGSECYGANILSTGSTLAAATECALPCAGDKSQTCGGYSKLNLYEYTSSDPAPVNPLPAGWSAEGCFTELKNARAIVGFYVSSTKMTPALCVKTCAQKGYAVAGVEYFSQCFCGPSFSSLSTKVSDGDCSAPCTGDKTQQCGGSSRLNVFTLDSASVTVPSKRSIAGRRGIRYD